MTEKERFGTINAFQRLFAEEGVEVTYQTIATRIELAKQTGLITIVKTARIKTGRIIREGFYLESEVRAACRDLFNRLDAQYFSDPARILSDLTSFAQQLGEDKSPPDLSTSNFRSLSITCHNGETVKGTTYLRNAAIALGLTKDSTEAGSKRAETLALLLKTSGIEIRDNTYYQNKDFVLYDLNAFAQQLGADKSPPDLSTGNLPSLSITCHNGETVKGTTYLNNAAIALGLAKNDKEAGSKRAETLALLLKTSGIEIRDNTYYHNKDFVLYDLTSFAQQLGEDKSPPDLSTSNLRSLSITCHNGETVKGETYLRNAAIALGLTKNDKEARSKYAETLRTLKRIAGLLPQSTKSDD